jgi:hypothetical protein
MDKWRIVQAGVITGVVVVTGVEVWKNPGDNPHAENSAKGSAERIGYVTMLAGSSGASGRLAPFRPMDEGGYRKLPSDVRYDAGEQQTPFPLRFS